jgi:hypothetical protein
VITVLLTIKAGTVHSCWSATLISTPQESTPSGKLIFGGMVQLERGIRKGLGEVFMQSAVIRVWRLKMLKNSAALKSCKVAIMNK